MPGCVTHLIIAQRLLRDATDAWADAVAHQNLYLLGANGPDCGAYPGGKAVLTELSHYAGSGDLCRKMFTLAKTPQQRAFSLGWLTHVVADAIMHPIVNREAGRRLGMRGIARYFDDPVMHLKVELGFDAKALGMLLHPFRSPRALDMEATGCFLHLVYTSNYNRAFDISDFSASLSALSRCVPWMSRISQLNYDAHRRSVSVSKGVLATLRTICLLARGGDALKAVFATLPPTANFDREMLSGIDHTLEACRRFVTNGIESLENINLDTGESCENENYPPAIRVKSMLVRDVG